MGRSNSRDCITKEGKAMVSYGKVGDSRLVYISQKTRGMDFLVFSS